MVELARLRNEARARGKLGAAVKAEFLRGRLCGHYDRKAEPRMASKFDGMSDEQLRAHILEQDEALRALGIEMVDVAPTPKLITGPKKR